MQNTEHIEIIDLVEKKSLCQYKKGDLIIEQGEKINFIICIQQGTAKIVHKNTKGKEFTFLNVQKGDYLGIHSLLNKGNSYVSVIATAPLIAYKITEEDLNRSRSKNTLISLELIKHLCSKIGLIETKISKNNSKNIKSELVKILLTKRSEAKTGETIIYSINELANLVGTTKNYIYQVLSEFEHLKIISVKDKKVNVLDERKLKEFENVIV
jgi:CRP-like cAMP-binding protein